MDNLKPRFGSNEDHLIRSIQAGIVAENATSVIAFVVEKMAVTLISMMNICF